MQKIKHQIKFMEAIMGFREKTKSPVATKADNRYSGMQVVDANQKLVINYGTESNPLSVTEMKVKMDELETKRVEYNKGLKRSDELANEYEALENELNEMCTKVLSGALSKFGSDSDEYEQLGGTRKSDRKKTSKKQTTTK
jgi:hypothetical protein